MLTTILASLPLLASSAVAAAQYGVVDLPQARFERRIAPANSTTSLVERSTIEKRAYSGRATWYQAGLGACGGVNSADDKIVALGQVIWDTQPAPGNNPNNSPWCGKKICITYGAISQEATIVDLCPYSGGCSPSDGAALDMSESLFAKFGGLGLGVFQMTWTEGGCGGGSPAPVAAPAVNLKAPVANNDQADQDQADADKAAAEKKAADDAAWAKQQGDKKAADDAAWAKQQADKKAADDAAWAKQQADKKAAADAAWAKEQASNKAAADAKWALEQAKSSADNAQYLASVSSQSEADALYAQSTASAASVARQLRIASQSAVSVASARAERIESRSEASVASVSSVRSERIESRSIASVQSVKSESRSSASAASTSVAPVMDAMVDVASNLAAMFEMPKATPTPSARPSRS